MSLIKVNTRGGGSKAPTQQIFDTAGTHTYTKPSGCSKVKVQFHVTKQMKGKKLDFVELEVLKFGVNLFSLGEIYKVSLKNNLICSIEKLRS